MAIVLFLAIGLVIGLLAHAAQSEGRKLGAPMTIWLGVAGSLIGALLTSFLTLQRVTEFHALGVIGSIVGTFVVLASGGVFRRTAVA